MYCLDFSNSGDPLGRGPKATSRATWSNARCPENCLQNVSAGGGGTLEWQPATGSETAVSRHTAAMETKRRGI